MQQTPNFLANYCIYSLYHTLGLRVVGGRITQFCPSKSPQFLPASRSAETSVSQAANVLSGQVQQVAAQTSSEMSRIAEKVTQQLESEINAVASSTAVIAEVNTRVAIEGMRRDVELQLDQTREDSRHREEEMRRQLDEVTTGLERLTKELNDFKPVSENVAREREQ